MDNVDYLEEANRRLTDERFYKKLDSDPTEEFSTKMTQVTKSIKDSKVVFLLGFGFHELFFLIPRKGDLIIIFRIARPIYRKVSLFGITDLNKSLMFSDTNNINERLQDIYKIQSLKLREKYRKKLFRDGINPNKNTPSESSVTSGETTA
jgi:hypothetical protein